MAAPTLTFGSLFAGIGGFDLGLERAGLTCAWQVEWDPFCQDVLARHWPEVLRYGDVEQVHGPNSCSADGCGQCLSLVDVLCAGFPCQPVCFHGKHRGTADHRWLWPEVVRLLGELEPGYLLIENVVGLLDGPIFRSILVDLAALGFDAEWECVPAVAVGAPHRRARIWLVAYRADDGCEVEPTSRIYGEGPRRQYPAGRDPYPPRRNAGPEAWRAFTERTGAEPGILRGAYGLSRGLDRVRALGNAVVPDLAEWIGRRIVLDATSSAAPVALGRAVAVP